MSSAADERGAGGKARSSRASGGLGKLWQAFAPAQQQQQQEQPPPPPTSSPPHAQGTDSGERALPSLRTSPERGLSLGFTHAVHTTDLYAPPLRHAQVHTLMV